MDNLITTAIIPAVRITNMILIIGTIAVWIYAYFRCKRQPALLAPIFWLADVLGFYIFRFYALDFPTKTNINLINLWSSVIIFHGIVLLLFVAWLIEFKSIKFRDWRQNEKI